MFEQNDLEVLQERINIVWASRASPEIIIAGKDRVLLREVAADLPLDRCTILVLYNRYKDRRYEGGIIGLAEIAASISYSEDDLHRVMDIIRNDSFLLSRLNGDISTIRDLYGSDITIDAETPIPVSTYVSSLSSDIHSIYRRLRGMMNITGHILSIKAVIGGIFFGLQQSFPEEDIKDMLYKLESRSSIRYISRDKIQDYIDWYDSRMKETLIVPVEGVTPVRSIEIGFYEESFKRLDDIERGNNTIYQDLQIFSPQLKTERYTIHPPIDIDIVDLISSATTSRDMPLIAADIEGKKIIKKYNGMTPDPSWFVDLDTDTMRIYVRTSKTKEKYQLIRYNIVDNYFLLESQSKLLPIDDIISTLCSHLDVDWITRPETYSSTYTSISNRINLDRDVLAWLITNPPEEYAKAGIGQYVFVKEESKPNAVKDKTNIHIQLGEDKMYISTSQSETTSGTLVPQYGRRWIGFNTGQKFFNISVNRTPNLSYANICLNIYRHVVAMYFKYYQSAKIEIDTIAKVISNNPPILNRLIERTPSLVEQYESIDLDLYKYIPSSITNLLPVPVDREDSHIWKKEGYSILHLPTIIANYPFISIATSEDIWVRTPRPGRFLLVQKSNKDYIPVLYTGKGFGILLSISENGVVTGEVQEISYAKGALGESSSTFGKVGRLVSIPESLKVFLRPIGVKGTTYRMAITPNILVNLNEILESNKKPEDVARYAYMCKQENWTQSVRDIEADILLQKIDPLRHFRALEEAFKVNLYYLEDDIIEPRLIKPPHAMFYLHRRGNPAWPSIIFYYMNGERTVIIRRDYRTKHITYIFDDASPYLDRIMDESNVIHMISPTTDTDTILQYQAPPPTLDTWILFEQVIDDYGKVRSATYRSKSGRRMATIYIGFSPIIPPDNGRIIPIGDIVTPTISYDIPDIMIDIGWMEKNYIVYPERKIGFDIWRKKERDARMLRAIALLLYSYTDLSLEDFVDGIEIDADVVYDTSHLTNILPDINIVDPWEYFSSTSMVRDTHLVVPSDDTRDSLHLYLMAIQKVQWPRTLPHYVTYSWDIRSSEIETVFLSEESALSTVMMESYPVESDTLIISPVAYILRQGSIRYLIQMVKDVDHARYIAYEWIRHRRNVGYSSYEYIEDENLPDIPEVFDMISPIEQISYTIYNTHTFTIIPL